MSTQLSIQWQAPRTATKSVRLPKEVSRNGFFNVDDPSNWIANDGKGLVQNNCQYGKVRVYTIPKGRR